MNRNVKIFELRNQGKTYKEIAKQFDISPQRIHQIISGYKSPKHKIRKSNLVYNPYYLPERKNPSYPEGHVFTINYCKKCGEAYECNCVLKHICRKQNSYPEREK